MLFLLEATILCLVVVNAHTQSCGGQDDIQLQRQRIQSIRTKILAQLGPEYYSLSTNGSVNGTRVVDNATVEAFYATNSAAIKHNKMKRHRERHHGYYAEKIISLPAISLPSQSVGKRAASNVLQISVLNTFRIQFNFSVDQQLSDITKADLLLLQLPCSNNETCSGKQYVEIRSVSTVDGAAKIVSGAYVSLTDSGYHTFDVMEAVTEWLNLRIRGLVSLDVITYCFTSLDCNKPINGTPPTRIRFVNATANPKTVPRLNLNVRNPLENTEEGGRGKRQSSGVGLCSANQALCCLQPLTVNFQTDLNMHFVISPTSVQINYCQGVCPRTPGGNLMTPQIFATYSELLSGPAASLTPCCSGNTYQSITALVQNAQGATSQLTLPDIVVVSCRCA